MRTKFEMQGVSPRCSMAFLFHLGFYRSGELPANPGSSRHG
ncbi:hypothetical protein CGRA01v4_07398 [Colletotrichum graminicola]|nr:hypothetical protein CGRA01v4_07398 [Colletotrichum graminicola]